jgi:hypothetical protein
VQDNIRIRLVKQENDHLMEILIFNRLKEMQRLRNNYFLAYFPRKQKLFGRKNLPQNNFGNEYYHNFIKLSAI